MEKLGGDSWKAGIAHTFHKPPQCDNVLGTILQSFTLIIAKYLGLYSLDEIMIFKVTEMFTFGGNCRLASSVGLNRERKLRQVEPRVSPLLN